MATPIGTNEINSISRRYIMPQLTDNIYNSNLMFFRLNQMNKKMLQGGLQIEVPLVYQRFAAGGAYQGFDLLDVSPSDTVKNAAFDWKQAYVPVSVDGLTLIRSDSPEAIVNFLSFYFENAQAELAEILGTGVWSDVVSNPKAIDGLAGAVDDSTLAATYGGLSRTANTWWRSTRTSNAAAALTLSVMQTMFGTLTSGGRHPTILVGNQAAYNKFWGLNQAFQAFPAQPAGQDETLAQAGFSNLLFNGVPFAVDSHCPQTAGTDSIFYLNEDYMYLYVNPRADFSMKEFREPVNQDAMTSLILWAGNLVLSNCARQGKLFNFT